MIRYCRFSSPLMFAIVALVTNVCCAGDKANDLRVMSYNIRYGTARDGENHWDRRKEFLVQTIRTFDPDLLGTQETLASQRDYLLASLPEFDGLGVGRDDGALQGEMMALFYRRDRFEKLDGGHFWLSQSPEKVGSKSWDSSLPRMVTWVKLRDKKQPDGRPIAFFNTHFDHLGATARLESAKLIRRQCAVLGDGCSIVITGDFNAGDESPPYHALFGLIEEQASPIVDTYRTTNPDRRPDEGTFTGFKADATNGPRIDWIGASRDWQVRSSGIDRTSRDGRTPSDHFAVTAVLRLKQGHSSVRHPFVIGGDYSVQTFSNISYDDRDDLDKHKLDLYLPRGITGFPVLFYVHGGGWSSGDRKLYGLVGRTFARNGIGVVVISYRLSPQVQHPAHIEDVARAFAWTHRHISEYGGDPNQIFVSGHSAGGHLSSLLACDETYLKHHGLTLKNIRGAIPISGIYIFQKLPLSERVLGKEPDVVVKASTVTYVSGDEPPFLILYGSGDFPGCGDQSQKLCDSLKAAGIEAEVIEIANRSHITVMTGPMFSTQDPAAQAMLRFIAKHSQLKLVQQPEVTKQP